MFLSNIPTIEEIELEVDSKYMPHFDDLSTLTEIDLETLAKLRARLIELLSQNYEKTYYYNRGLK